MHGPLARQGHSYRIAIWLSGQCTGGAENLERLKELNYLNLAVNNITRVST